MLNRAAVYGVEEQGLWMRAVYRARFLDQTITAVVRPRDRSNPNDKNFIPQGMPLPVRFINVPGRSEKGVVGDLLPDDGMTIKRVGCVVKKLGELTEDDLKGCAPDSVTPELARYHVSLVYNTELLDWDEMVTVWRFVHLPNVME